MTTRHWDFHGNPASPSRQTLVAVLAALGVAAATDEEIEASLREAETAPWRQVLPELSKNTIAKASIIATLSLTLVVVDTFILSIIEPEFSFMQILFEVTSAFGTVGLSTGITRVNN
ncbi:MAG: 4-alpha-glucanotransferase, partial [Clostridium butyricum DORA_1]